MPQGADHWRVITEASVEVGPALFFSLLIITLSFLPVFTLEAQEGRLFKPLAFTKTYAMAASAALAVTLTPVLMGYWIRGRIPHENDNPVNRFLIWVYRPVIEQVLRAKAITIAVATFLAVGNPRSGTPTAPPAHWLPSAAVGGVVVAVAAVVVIAMVAAVVTSLPWPIPA